MDLIPTTIVDSSIALCIPAYSVRITARAASAATASSPGICFIMTSSWGANNSFRFALRISCAISLATAKSSYTSVAVEAIPTLVAFQAPRNVRSVGITL